MADDDNDYQGSCTVVCDEQEIEAEVVLRGHVEPVDGRFHWYGRLSPHDAIDTVAGGRKREIVLRTPDGEASGTISDPDPWGRYRVTGIGRPPFAMITDVELLDQQAETAH